nr:OmpH family outer membrane protein [uncultured Allomuricauda sp.]
MKIFIVLISLCIFSPSITKAQNNIAKLNYSKLYEEFPEKEKYVKKLEKMSLANQNRIEDLYSSLNTMAKDYEKEADLKSDEINESRMKELKDSRDYIEKTAQTMAVEFEDEQTKIINMMRDNIKSAVLEVAKNENLDFVIDSSSENNIIKSECRNIYNEVLTELKKIMVKTNPANTFSDSYSELILGQWEFEKELHYKSKEVVQSGNGGFFGESKTKIYSFTNDGKYTYKTDSYLYEGNYEIKNDYLILTQKLGQKYDQPRKYKIKEISEDMLTLYRGESYFVYKRK